MSKIKILITTDNHLGFKEKDPIRNDDSFIAFEDVLEIPSKHDVDMILILGDLFHEANTTLYTLNWCMDILNWKVGRTKNYENVLNLDLIDNLRLDYNSLPTIIIHGNHDLPIDEYKNGSLDILEKAGYIKYIGKF